MNNKRTFDVSFWCSLLVFCIIVVVICLLPSLMVRPGMYDFSNTGQIGDTIGGIMGPFVAIAASFLTFIAFWVQYKANVQQRHDIALERFESNLFEMIHIQQDIVKGLVLEEYNMDSKITRSEKGRDVFQFVYEDAPHRIDINNLVDFYTLKKALSISDELKCSIHEIKSMWFLDHYYRHLYRIFKYIDEADSTIASDDRKKNYTGIVKATLSPYELVMLFYNSFSHPKFQNLIIKYNVMDNLRSELLASQEDKNLLENWLKQTK